MMVWVLALSHVPIHLRSSACSLLRLRLIRSMAPGTDNCRKGHLDEYSLVRHQ